MPEDTNYLVSSDAFNIESTQGCSTFIWIVPIILALMAVFVIMRLLNGQYDNKTLALCIGMLVGIYVVFSFASGVCII